MRILVIEDEVKLATHLSRALESEGHEARVVHDGKVGLVEAREIVKRAIEDAAAMQYFESDAGRVLPV